MVRSASPWPRREARRTPAAARSGAMRGRRDGAVVTTGRSSARGARSIAGRTAGTAEARAGSGAGAGRVAGAAGATAAGAEAAGELRPEALAALPSWLRAELMDALLCLDVERVSEIIRRVSERDAALGRVLAEHAGGLAYTFILQSLRAADRDAARGAP